VIIIALPLWGPIGELLFFWIIDWALMVNFFIDFDEAFELK
jgi:hypothetical protein